MADKAKLLEVLGKIIADVNEQKDFLTQLDNVIGDGDHGINLDRGFKAVEKQMPSYADLGVDEILKDVGKQLMKVVGGSSGPLYGQAYKKAGVYLKGKTEITMDDLLAMLDIAIEQIQRLGHAVEGEKTMIDSMIPASKAMKESYAADGDAKKALEAGVAAAEAGIEYTKTIIATKGRASYLGERSLGHQDPGATSFTLMLKAIAELA
ncbi:MAG: dihydroxyacetone kinase subunit DhaL [Eubacteriales bacterium]|nr:dihydroxyacetone kinase subunit DhaL [Eubacteriales bacterium]